MLPFMWRFFNINSSLFFRHAALVIGLFTMPNLEFIKSLKNMLQYYNI